MDLLVVGCGLRATGLLTSTPALFSRDLGVIDAADQLCVGSFRHYDIESNSSGTDFFGWIDPVGMFGPVLAAKAVRGLREVPGAFQLSRLADALARTGQAISDELGPDRLFLGERVIEIALSGAEPALVRTERGRTVRARTVVVATGIRERANPELRRWRAKTVSSGALIAPDGRHRCADISGAPGMVCLAGASHSAFSVLNRLLACRPGNDPEIVLVTRSPVKLYYSSRDSYRAVAHPATEAVPDPDRGNCPETGNVHRYSGLRNTSKALFRAVALGEVPGVRLVVAPDAADREPYFERSAKLIAATGYESDLPVITVGGRRADVAVARGVVRNDGHGRMYLNGDLADSLFVMGMDPYPYEDSSINPTSQYARRGRDILGHLSERQARGTYQPMSAMRRIRH